MPGPSLKQIAFDTIRQKILTFEYEPNQFLNEDTLCTDLGMSRTPVRDALSRLEQEGLITIIPKKGFFIAPLSMNEINMVYEGRLLIEPYIITTYCSHLSDEDLDILQENIRRQQESMAEKNGQGMYALDNELHHFLIGHCTNTYLLALSQRLDAQNSRMRILSGRADMDRLSQSLAEHITICRALIDHNAPEAAEAMRRHLNNGKESTYKGLIRNNSSF